MTTGDRPDGDASALASTDDSGTDPHDRPFRPDVEGLRAIAIALVVLFHFQFAGFAGGFVGVDVFFVVSGFVITGLLLRKHHETGTTSLFDFYARRVKRILPAATLVVLATVVASALFLNHTSTVVNAKDGRWVAVFLANFHFGAHPTLLASLDNFWSLSVEEQFYVVFPALFLLLTWGTRGLATRRRLVFALVGIVAISFVACVLETTSSPRWAYLSPFTRAWELALGGLVAVSVPWLRRWPGTAAWLATWVGLGLVLVAGTTFRSSMPYPGWEVTVPVVGTALVIAGGTAVPRFGVEWLLNRRGFLWIAQRSYSIYLWHWPLLTIIVAAGVSPAVRRWRVLQLGLTVALSMATYRFLENPIRHMRIAPRKAVAGGVLLIAGTVLVLSLVIA